MASARPDSAGMATYRVHWCAVRGRRQGRLSRRWGPGPLPAREKREAGVPGVWRGWTPGGQEGPGTEAKAQGGGQGQLSGCGTSGEGTCQVRWAMASGVSAGRHPARSRPRGQRANGGHQSLVTKTVTPPRQAPPPPTPPSSAAAAPSLRTCRHAPHDASRSGPAPWGPIAILPLFLSSRLPCPLGTVN